MPPKTDKRLPHAEIIRYVRERTPDGHVLLSFSGGKDAWATWLGIRDHFEPEKITPFYYYLVPGLEFIEEYLEYAEKVLGTHIIQGGEQRTMAAQPLCRVFAGVRDKDNKSLHGPADVIDGPDDTGQARSAPSSQQKPALRLPVGFRKWLHLPGTR